jgi:hypothetical protein
LLNALVSLVIRRIPILMLRVCPGIRDKLHRLTPRDEKGRLKHRLFQRLTKDVGHPKLKEHLDGVTTLTQK